MLMRIDVAPDLDEPDVQQFVKERSGHTGSFSGVGLSENACS